MTKVYHRAPITPTHNGVIGVGYWTVLATRTGGYWKWRDENDKSTEAQEALRARCDANEIILMHRHGAEDWELVAQLAGPAWRRFQARSARR